MVYRQEITRITDRYNQLLPLGREVCRIVEESGVQEGIVI